MTVLEPEILKTKLEQRVALMFVYSQIPVVENRLRGFFMIKGYDRSLFPLLTDATKKTGDETRGYYPEKLVQRPTDDDISQNNIFWKNRVIRKKEMKEIGAYPEVCLNQRMLQR